MKILRIRLSNLNSLRGPSAIDFTAPPLAGAGLFAITGPTGAGKTTLLDAITLALYGRVARYGSTPSPDAVMSRHTGECSAEVEFSCAAGMFRSTWHLTRARKRPDGNIQPAKRRVIELPAESVIAESIKDADAAIVELTGLDYDRFLRSVLLAQGEFAAFLQAGPKERTELLQEVTGTAIYQDISQAAYRRAAKAEQAHVTLSSEYQAVKVLTEAERSQLVSKRTESTHRANELTSMLQERIRRINEAERWLELVRSSEKLAADQIRHVAARRAAEADLSRLAKHEQASPFISALTSLDLLTVAQRNDAKALEVLEAKHPEVIERLRIAETAAGEAKIALETADGRQPSLRLLWVEVTELDQALATARTAARHISEQQASVASNVASLSKSLESDTAILRQLASNYKDACTWLTEHAIDVHLSDQLPELQAVFERWSAADQAALTAQRTLESQRQEAARLAGLIQALEETLPPLQRDLSAALAAVDEAKQARLAVSGQLPAAEIEARRDQTRERRLTLERLLADAARLRALAVELVNRQTEAKDKEAAITASAEERKLRQERKNAVIQLLSSERNTLRYAEQLQTLAGQRRELQEDKPCPLCGALHHPYASGDLPADELAAIRQRVAAAENSDQAAQRELTEAEKRQAALTAEQTNLVTEIDLRTREISALTTEWNSVATTYGLVNEFTNEQLLNTRLLVFQTEEGRSTAQVAAVRAAEVRWQSTKDSLQVAQKAVDRAKADEAQQRALATHVEKQLPPMAVIVSEHTANSNDQRAQFTHLVSTFTAGPSILADVPALLAMLKTRQATFAIRQGELLVLEGNRGRQSTKCESLVQQLAAAKVTSDEILAKVNLSQGAVVRLAVLRREKFGDRTVTEARTEEEASLDRARQLAASRREEADKLRQEQAAARQEIDRLIQVFSARKIECQTAVAQLRADIKAADFTDESELRTSILPEIEVQEILRRRRLLDEERVALTTLEADFTRKKALLTAASIDSVNLVALKSELASGEADRAALQITLGEIGAILRNDDEQRARQLIFAAQIEAAHRDLVRWGSLRALIGSADGSLFARFAQALTLERLTVLANRYLESLNPRYSIRRMDSQAGDLELEIVDHYQADVARPMRSLSGGESFLASLALALGLSELASGQTSIESLFIDEGFGSLDADTLETAMSALENLQAKGKTIGVISHVAAMQERIPTQIRVIKEAGGCSKLALEC